MTDSLSPTTPCGAQHPGHPGVTCCFGLGHSVNYHFGGSADPDDEGGYRWPVTTAEEIARDTIATCHHPDEHCDCRPITDKMVEAAAKSLMRACNPVPWSEIGDSHQDDARKLARAALEAALGESGSTRETLCRLCGAGAHSFGLHELWCPTYQTSVDCGEDTCNQDPPCDHHSGDVSEWGDEGCEEEP